MDDLSRGLQVGIVRIDGVPTEIHPLEWQEYELLPGPHLLEVGLAARDQVALANVLLPLIVEGGRAYEVRADIVDPAWPFHTGRWTAWVVDAATGAAVSGTPIPTPTLGPVQQPFKDR